MHVIGSEGVEKNMLLSYVWFSLAEAEGYDGAKEAVAEVRGQMTPEEIKQIAATLQKIQSKIRSPRPHAPLPTSTAPNQPL
jgi:hypothetical protein